MKKQSRAIYRWFGLSMFVILMMSSWIKGLYEDIDSREFDIEIYKIRGTDYDSILRARNYTIDSLKKTKIEKSEPILPKKTFKKVSDTLLPIKDTLYTLPVDTFKLLPIDTIK